ncbi:MAG: acetate--CoA ligase family protein [archaeon]|uniref:acetate--CoA ligase (ADP-forming) n=1 Tax=Methanobrevibacter gottschalkii DSM 11977 TaxID=1122229 RepID=A0A3N5B337_9EURY|nr:MULTISPECIES: acetate--CoA ligase [Methanobrevibacter]MCQ2971110.1 acetate--CoA ligase family protein [archaeon]OEC99553.1 acyl-CoA synthetase [Methanobrevibacter sp. A27]RPF51703.1 acetyltransferase [Methanobrevibacter gottschalkii DSM 11977]
MVDLNKMFKPESVAVIGASNTPGKVGYIIVDNLINDGFKGEIYPINPKGGEILGKKAYANIEDVPGKVDLAIITIPSVFVNAVVKECGEAGVEHMVVITAGFKEVGDEGAKLEAELTAIGKEYGINIIGPNSLGITDSHTPMNGSFSQMMPPTGNMAFISQSGAMMVAIIDWSVTSGIGFSKVISLGNKAGVNEIELLQYLADDDETKVIICYLESISENEDFVRTMRETARKKPIIILKSGSSSAGAAAASSHTGALAGSDLAFDTAFRQSGIIRVDTMAELFDLGLAFSKAPLPRGDHVAIITNAGGGGVVTVDAMEKAGLKLVQFDEETTERLKKCVTEEGSAKNPIDVLGDAPVSRYKESLEIVLSQDEVDSLIVMVCPTASADPDGIANAILEERKEFDKPIIVVNMGGPSFEKANDALRENGVPTYVFPETAVTALKAMTDYAKLEDKSYDDVVENIDDVDKDAVKAIFEKVKADGRDTLLGSEAYAVAEAYGISAAPIKLSTNAEEAASLAEEMEFPVVLKIASDKILHKSDIGGVKVGISSAEEAKSTYDEIIANAKAAHPDIIPDGVEVQKMMDSGEEVIVGMIRDEQFGPMIAFGMGGIYVNLIEDVSFNLAKGMSSQEIDEQINTTKVSQLLAGYRGEAACDVEEVKEAIKRVARLTLDFPEISELDINPIFVYEEGSSALDIKIKL